MKPNFKTKNILIDGEECQVMLINWTTHLDQAYQCNWRVNEWKTEITYGATPEEAEEKMERKIRVLRD